MTKSIDTPLVGAVTLRDYFAGQVLAGTKTTTDRDEFDSDWWYPPEKIAARCYQIADAMLAARRKKS